MKLIKKIFLFAAVPFLLVSCGGGDASPLSYQNGAVGAVCDIETGGETLGISIERSADDAVIVMNSPECVKGSSFIRRGGEYFIDTGGGEIPLPERLLGLTDPVFDAFALPDGEDDIRIISDDGQTFTVTTEEGVYTVTLGRDGMPEEIAFDGKRDFVMKNISVMYAGG